MVWGNPFMASKKWTGKKLDEILNETIEKVSTSKNELFEISEQSRKEYDRLVSELDDIKAQVINAIDEGDKLEEQARLARMRLADVSKHFDRYEEEEIRQVYETANKLQVKLSYIRQKEAQLREKRDELERRLVQVKETTAKAERLTGQISVVLNYLRGDLKQIGAMIEDANRRQMLGLKIIEAQEEERRRLSREIHDGPAQTLANMLLRSELVEKVFQEKGTSEGIAEIRELRSMVKNSLHEVRRIIYDLRPMALDDLGLIPTLNKYLKTVEERFGLHVVFQVLGEERRLSPKLEIALFRLIQEGVQNACKHAEANKISVKMEFRENDVILSVKDDGKGFDLHAKKEGAFGLIGMNERVEMLEGKLSIHSEEGKGTIIFIRIPVRE